MGPLHDNKGFSPSIAKFHYAFTSQVQLMRIALAQIDCRLGNIPANRERHQQALAETRARGGADLVVFPELSVTGYRLRSDIYRVLLDEAQFARYWARLRDDAELAQETVVSLGYVELTDRSIIHNTTALLQSAGTLFQHRKVYLPTYGMFEEERYMRPGRRLRITTLTTAAGERWRVGVLCCEDAWHCSAWAIMQAYAVDLIIVPSASPGRGVESERLGSQRSWYGILSTQAEMSGCWVAYCNRVGFEDDINFWGGSAIFAPSGEMRASAALMDTDLLIYNIDKRAVTTARISAPLIADENWDLTVRELREALRERVEEG